MRSTQAITLLLLGTIFTVSVVLALLSFGIISGPKVAQVKNVEPGCHEIAFLAPATSFDTWERIIEAAEQINIHWQINHKEMKPLHLDTSAAWPKQSAGVPEVAIWVGNGNPKKLLVRWYKISGEKNIDEWVKDLAHRPTPPLAFIGGENTRRAKEISTTLNSYRNQWNGGKDPIFLITTATADKLMEIYKNRNFRFSFPNSQMTKAVLDFVDSHPDLLWPKHQFDFKVATAMMGARDGLASTMLLHVEQKALNYAMFAVSWEDDGYSRDLEERFRKKFQERYYPWTANLGPEDIELILRLPKWIGNDVIAYSTGNFFHPNYPEIAAASRYFEDRDKSKTVRQLLVLPTGTERARRYLKTVINSDPKVAQNLVVLSGDSITFNQIYRDRKFAWNILDLPVPLVFFSHRNPVYSDPHQGKGKNSKVGFLEKSTEERPSATTGTQDLLLFRDIMEAIIVASYRDESLVIDADELDRRLQQLNWVPIWDNPNNGQKDKETEERNKGGLTTSELEQQSKKPIDGFLSLSQPGNRFFDAERNRSEETGEYVILLQPQYEEFGFQFPKGLLHPQSTITIWSRITENDAERVWVKAACLPKVYYADAPTLVVGGQGALPK